jgi:hypothetical protein
MGNNVIQVFSDSYIVLFGPYQNLNCVKSLADFNHNFGFHFIAEHMNMGSWYCLLVLLFIYFSMFWRAEGRSYQQIKDWITLKQAMKKLDLNTFLRFFLKFSLFMIMVALVANSMAYGRGVWHYFFPSVMTDYEPNRLFLALATFPRAAFNALIFVNLAIVIFTFTKVIWLSFKYGLSYDEQSKKYVLELIPSSIVFASLLAISILFFYHQAAMGVQYKFYLVCPV